MTDPHHNQPFRTAGPALQDASAAVLLVHGRGSSADDMIRFADTLEQPHVSYRAIQAAGRSWYPQSFLAPLPYNEPGLSSGLAAIAAHVSNFVDSGMPAERIVLIGFSQGACLTLEFAARNPQRLGGVLAWSGGLIGNGQREQAPIPNDKTFTYTGNLLATPVFLGCSDVDPHIPLARVEQSAEILEELGAMVTKRIYPGMGHTVNVDEIRFSQELLASF